MHAQDTPPPAFVEDLTAQLVPLLEAHGLTAAVERGGTIRVSNPAGGATDPRVLALFPGLNQRITVQDREDGPWWCWLWPGPERDAPPELEPMVPVEDIEEAARRLATVLRVDEPDEARR